VLRRHLFAILAVVAAASAAAALYVIPARTVHASAGPPPALAKLVPDQKPKTIPAVAFTDAKGVRLSLATFHGHYVLLNLWATWCAPCVKELPALAHLHSALPGLTIIAVSEGQEGPKDTAAFLKAHGAGNLAVYLDPDHAFLAAFGAFGLPLSTLVEPSGLERARAIGPADWDNPDAIAWLKAYISLPGTLPA
jgi:thiol-disulfide isomerase/thioredoxin